MTKRCRPAALALLLLLAVHLHPVYRVSVEGERIPGFYSAAQIRLARETAREAAEELLAGDAALPGLQSKLCLRIRQADGRTAALTDALLLAVDTVTAADAVCINGSDLGTVSDGERLLALLRRTVREGMPAGAAVGNLGGKLSIRPVYSRAGLAREDADVLSDILAAAPVFYLDGNGKQV